MPYINQEDRLKYNNLIEELSIEIVKKYKETLSTSFIPGHLSYIVYKLVKSIYTKLVEKYNIKYDFSERNQIMGFFSSCSMEYYRRYLAGYEDSAITKNGDI